MSQTPYERPILAETAADLSPSDRHVLLTSKHRRLTIDVLGTSTAPVFLDELAGSVTAMDERFPDADDGAVERVALRLHHVHLPKLAEFGLLTYDPAHHRIHPVDDPNSDSA